MRKFYVIIKVNNEDKFREIYDPECDLGNGLFRIRFDGNKRSTVESIIRQAKSNVHWHKGLKIAEVVDVIEFNK